MTKTQQLQTERDEAIAKLHEFLTVGDTIRTVLRHVSRSGMSRSISLFTVANGVPFELDYWAARAMGDRIDQTNGGIKIGGCGMDMGFALVYNLARTLWPEGFQCVGPNCPASDHVNPPRPPRDGNMFHTTNGGYALNQRWM